MDTSSNTKRVVIIFGGNGYVGSRTADLFEQAGWTALRAGRHALPDASHITCDVTESASAREAFETVLREHGRIDACVHAASPALERVPFLSASPKSFTAHLQTAVVGTMNIAQCARTMKNIVVITSQATDATKSKMGAYPFAKHLQHELCALLAHTLPSSTYIHAVAPGFLPGGLNMDLPQSVRAAFATQDDGASADATTIARIVVDICEQKPHYTTSGSVDGVTGQLTPF